jgi:hypothetical protein
LIAAISANLMAAFFCLIKSRLQAPFNFLSLAASYGCLAEGKAQRPFPITPV